MPSKEVQGQTHDGNWYVLIAGLPRPNQPRPLAPGLILCPLTSPLSRFDLASASAVGFREWAALEPIAGACTCEIEAAKDSEVLPGYDTLNRAWLVSGLLVLRGFSRHLAVACSSYPWNRVAGHQKRTSPIFYEQLQTEGVHAAVYESHRDLSRFHGNLLDFHPKLLINRGSRNDGVNEADGAWIQANFNSFNHLASESDSFRLALEAAIDWRYSKEPRLAIARLWSGIEAIFGISSELGYRISILSASLLEPRGELRKARFNQVKKLYGLRSKAVHGEALSQEQLVSAMEDSYNLLRELLLYVNEKRHVLTGNDFDEAVCG
jgi:hypothetical protein